MVCRNCGNQIEAGEFFCTECGTAVMAGSPVAGSAGKKTGIKIAIIAAVCIVIVAAVLTGVFLYNRPAKRLARALDLGQRYLLEKDYEQAIVEFKKAIKIDPKNVDAYFGLADAYVGQGDYENALEQYDLLLELDEESKKVLRKLEKCLNAYIEVLEEEGKWDEIQRLTEKYQEIVTIKTVASGEEAAAETTETTETTEAVEPTPEEPEDTSWARIYYDYLTTDSEGISIMETYGGKYWGGDHYVWSLIYTDDDKVPELYMQSEIQANGDVLLHISGGKVMYEYFSSGGGSYIPYSGWIQNTGGRMGYEWGSIYHLENGVMQEKGNYSGMISADGNGMEDAVYHVGENEVSQEQYDEFVRNSTGGAEFQSCMNFENPVYESCLDFLSGVMQRG